MELPRIDEIREEKLVEVEPETTEEIKQEEVAPEEVQEEPKVESPEVPVSFQKRIDELTYKYKSEREARQKLEEQLKSQRQDPAQPTSEEAVKEQNAKQYLKDLYKEVISEQKSQEQQEEAQLNAECDHVATLYPDFNKTEVLKVMDEFGVTDVEKAYLGWKKMNRVVEQTKEETKKDILSKPKNPSAIKTQDSFATKFSDENIRGKSLWELAEEAKREAGF